MNPYKCDKCPSKVIASHMLQDLETSCNIPSWLGLETEADLDPLSSAEVKDSIIYHSKQTQTSTVHP